MKDLGFTDKVVDYLKLSKVDSVLYDKVESNPSKQTVDFGAKVAKDNGCGVIVALCGGSVLDAAKGIAVVRAHGGEVWDYIGSGKVPGPALPVIAVPTTAGTGSEVTHYAVISFKGKKLKSLMASPFIFPKVAIVDPTLMVSMSAYLTADTGIDALCHAIEDYTSRLSHPISDEIALQATELCAGNLPVVVMNGDNLEARANMALASSSAGMEIAQAGCGNAHVLGNTLGGFFDTEHGTIVGILLPHVMEQNMFTNLGKFAKIAQAMGDNVNGLSLRSAAHKAVEAVRNLLSDVGLPQRLRDLGITKDAIPAMVEESMKRDPNAENPRTVTIKEVRGLFDRGY